jgi:hypothetical protein
MSGEGIIDSSGKLTITHKIAADGKTEGEENLQFKFFSDSSRTIQVTPTSSIKINDLSVTPPTYSISQSPSGTANEGSNLVTTVQTTNLLPNTLLYWKAEGSGIDADDFVNGSAGLAGEGTVDANGQVIITHNIKADNKIEGDETLQLRLFSDSAGLTQVGTTASAIIADTSKPPATYSIAQLPNGTVNEGADLVTTVQTNLAKGTKIYWSAGGTNIELSDFSSGSSSLSGEGTVDENGKVTVTHKIAVDSKTEGDERLELKFFSDSNRLVQVLPTASTSIKDLSLTPATYSISQSPTEKVNEGSSLLTTIQTTNLTQGTPLYWKAEGTGINANDFTNGSAGLTVDPPVGPATPVTAMETCAREWRNAPSAMACAVGSLTAPCSLRVAFSTPSMSCLASLE